MSLSLHSSIQSTNRSLDTLCSSYSSLQHLYCGHQLTLPNLQQDKAIDAMSKVRGGKAHARAVEGKEEYGVWEELPIPRLDRDADISQLRRELHIDGRQPQQISSADTTPLPEFTNDRVFNWRGIPVWVQTRHYVDHGLPKPFVNSKATIDLRKAAIALARPQPPQHLVTFLIARIKLSRPKSGRGSNPKWENLWRECFERLYREHDTWPSIEAEYSTSVASPAMVEAMEKAQTECAKFDTGPYLVADIMEAGAKSVYEHSPKDSIFIVLDKRGKVSVLSFPKALQWFYSAEVAQHIKEDVEFLFYVEPPFAPDKQRHPLNSLWIKEHPEFDMSKMSKEDDDIKNNRFHGVLHYGTHHEEGRRRPNKAVYHSDWLQPGGYTQALKENTMENAFGVMTRAVAFLHKLADPKSHDECLDVVRHTKRCIHTTTDEIYTMRAALGNLWTECHVDASDVHGGFAGLVYLGDYEGNHRSLLRSRTTLTQIQGGDLVLPEYGLVIPASHGSITLVRGHETIHCTLPWKGRSRICVVHTGHQSVLVDAMAEKKRRRVKESILKSRKRKREEEGKEIEKEEVDAGGDVEEQDKGGEDGEGCKGCG